MFGYFFSVCKAEVLSNHSSQRSEIQILFLRIYFKGHKKNQNKCQMLLVIQVLYMCFNNLKQRFSNCDMCITGDMQTFSRWCANTAIQKKTTIIPK